MIGNSYDDYLAVLRESSKRCDAFYAAKPVRKLAPADPEARQVIENERQRMIESRRTDG